MSFPMHPGNSAAAQVGSGWRRASVPASMGRGNGHKDNRMNKQALKNVHRDRFNREVEDIVKRKLADFIHGVHESDHQEISEIMNLKGSLRELKRMLEDQNHHRDGVERRLSERCERLDIEMTSLKSYDPMRDVAKLRDRIDALENGVGAATDRTTREVEALQSNYRDLRMELGVAREAVKSFATAVEVIEGSLRDVASKAAVNESLVVSKTRLDQTNTRLDHCESQCAELMGRSSLFVERAGRMEENLQGIASRCLAVEGLRNAIQNLQGHVKAQQDNFDSVEGLQQSVKDCQTRYHTLEEHCVSLMESTCALDKQLQDCGKNSTEDLQVVKAQVKDLYDILEKQESGLKCGLKDLIADEARLRELNQNVVHDRFDNIDRRLIDLVANMAKELKSSRDDVEQLMLAVQQDWSAKTKGLRNKKQQDNERQPITLLPADFMKS